jgi:hypothetical protein
MVVERIPSPVSEGGGKHRRGEQAPRRLRRRVDHLLFSELTTYFVYLAFLARARASATTRTNPRR